MTPPKPSQVRVASHKDHVHLEVEDNGVTLKVILDRETSRRLAAGLIRLAEKAGAFAVQRGAA